MPRSRTLAARGGSPGRALDEQLSTLAEGRPARSETDVSAGSLRRLSDKARGDKGRRDAFCDFHHGLLLCPAIRTLERDAPLAIGGNEGREGRDAK